MHPVHSKATFLNSPSNLESLPSLHLCATGQFKSWAPLMVPTLNPLKEAARLVKKTHPGVWGSQRAPAISLRDCGSSSPSSVTWGIWLRRSIWPLSTLTVLLSFLGHCPALLTLCHPPFLHLGISEIFIKQNNLASSLGFSFEHHQYVMWDWRWLAKKLFSLIHRCRSSKETSKVKWVLVGLIFRAF